MNRLTPSIFFILTFLFFSTSISAQSRIIEDIDSDDFYGVFEIENHGYLLSYEKKRKKYLEIYNHDLELISREITDFKISSHTKLAIRANDEHFILIMSRGARQDKNKYRLISYDFDGKKRNEVDVKAAIINVICADNNKGFFVVAIEKGKTRVKFFDNDLNKKWDKLVFGKSVLRTSNDLFLPYSIEGYLSKNYAVTSEGLYFVLTRPKGALGMKLTDQKIIGISNEGSKIFEKEYDRKTERILKIEAAGNNVLAFTLQGNFSRTLSPKVNKTSIEFLNNKETETEKPFAGITYFQEMVGRLPRYINRDFYKRGEEYIFILEDTDTPKYLVLRFDLKFNLIDGDEEIFYHKEACVIHEWALFGTKTLGKYHDALSHLNDYQFSIFTRDDELLIIYFQHNVRKNTVNLNVSSSLEDEENSRSILDDIKYVTNSSDNRVEVISYHLLRNEFNNGLYCYFNKKSSQIEMHITEF